MVLKMNTKSRKTKSAEAQIPQAPSEEDFVSLIKYVSEREKSLSRYSNKLRQSLQHIFNIFGDPYYCQICGYSENDTRHIKFRDEQGYLHYEETSTVNGITETYAKNKDYVHEFKPKIRVSEEIVDTEICIETAEDELNFVRYRLVFSDGKLLLRGWRNCEIDTTGVSVWFTEPEGTQHGGTPSRAELKQLVRSGRLPKFLAYAAEKLAEAETEYGEVSAIAEKMAKAIETDETIHTNAILKRDGAEEIGE